MSIWTHVNGSIRVDGYGKGGDEKVKGIMGNIVKYDSNDRNTTLPLGSEGSLQHNIWINPKDNSAPRYTISLWGDLRDYDNLDKIKEWFVDVLTKLDFIRDAVLTVDNGMQRKIFVYDGTDKINEIKY